MKRISKGLLSSDLPQVDMGQLSEDHQLYLRHMLGLLETGDMFHGRFVEVHVGRILGADIADRGVNDWDLRIGGRSPITVEVKATAEGGRYRLGPKRADVWVFVTFSDKAKVSRPGPKAPNGYLYCVASANAIEAQRAEAATVSQSEAFELFTPATASNLLNKVRSATNTA